MTDKRCKPVTIEGHTFVSVNAALLHYGTKYRTYRTRLECGWEPERALSQPVLKGNYSKVEI